MPDLLKMCVPGKPEYVRTVRMTAASIASDAGFDIEAIEDIKVAVSEACNNTIVHARESNIIDYYVEFMREDEKLTITVKDSGQGYDTDAYVEPAVDELQSGGLGLFIIKALMDEIDIESKPGVGTSIRMIKYLVRDIV